MFSAADRKGIHVEVQISAGMGVPSCLKSEVPPDHVPVTTVIGPLRNLPEGFHPASGAMLPLVSPVAKAQSVDNGQSAKEPLL